MGVEPFLLSSVLTGVLAQRLVRRLCPHCREPYEADPALLERLGIAVHEGESRTFYHPVGCPQCKGSGYAGRMAVFEFIRIDRDLAALILHRADTRAIADAAGTGRLRHLARRRHRQGTGRPHRAGRSAARRERGLTAMPTFQYRALGANGAAVSGQIEAASREDAIAALRKAGTRPIELAEPRPGAAAARKRGGEPPARLVTDVFAELGVLLQAGLPLDRALGIAVENVEQAALRSRLADVLSAVREGQPLSAALSAQPDLFPGLAPAMTEAGEANGKLGEALARLAQMLEQAGCRAAPPDRFGDDLSRAARRDRARGEVLLHAAVRWCRSSKGCLPPPRRASCPLPRSLSWA